MTKFQFIKQKISLILMMFILSLSNFAKAENNYSVRHWYVGGYLGTNFNANGNTQIPSFASKPPLTSEPVYHHGYLLSLTIGNQLSQHFRLESMLNYQYLPVNKINNAIGQGTVTYLDDSYTSLTSFLINGYYDFNPAWIVHPYIGLGGGYVKVKNMIRPSPSIPVAPGLFFTKKEINYNTLGYQGILGVRYPIKNNIDIDFNYKYFSTLKKSVTGYTNLGQDAYQTNQKITDNTISLGLVYYFG